MRLYAMLAVLVCVGLMSSCTFPDVSKLQSQSKSFAGETVSSLKPDWNTKALDGRLTKELTVADCELVFARFRKALGPIKSIGELSENSINYEAGINVPDCTASYTAPLTCEKGNAKIELSQMHKGGKWLITKVNITSPLFDKNPDLLVDSKVKAEAQRYANSIAKQFLKTWAYEIVEKEADSKLKEELTGNELGKVGSVAFKGILAAGKQAGVVDDFEPLKFSNWSTAGGMDVYTFIGNERSDKEAKIDITIQVVKESGKWKLHSLFFKAHS